MRALAQYRQREERPRTGNDPDQCQSIRVPPQICDTQCSCRISYTRLKALSIARGPEVTGAEVDALIGGGSTPATAAGSGALSRMVNPEQLRARAEECEGRDGL